jgi:DNA mismatch repair protein MutL
VRHNQNSLYVFINKRFIKSPSVIHAVSLGYGELLPRGNYPIGAVFLEIDPGKVDVNVHPTKAEVRLSEERQIHDIVYQAVKRTLRGEASLYHTRVIKDESHPERMTPAEAIRRAHAYTPPSDMQTVIKELYDNKAAPPENKPSHEIPEVSSRIESARPDKAENEYHASDEIDIERIVYLGSFAELYLLFKQGGNLILVDQHAAHERILFEEILQAMDRGAATSQNLLFPINIELSPERFALYEESYQVLSATGFVAEPFGSNAVLLSAVPISLSKKSPEKVFDSILEDVENLRKTGYELKKAVAESMACRAAVMAGDRLTEDEAKRLLRQLLQSENKHCCPHGRPTFLKISKNDLDVKFGRK